MAGLSRRAGELSPDFPDEAEKIREVVGRFRTGVILTRASWAVLALLFLLSLAVVFKPRRPRPLEGIPETLPGPLKIRPKRDRET